MRKKIEGDTICSECGTVLKPGEMVYFCDVCKRKIEDEDSLHSLTVFFNNGGSDDVLHLDICSWHCVFNWFKRPTVNTELVNFIDLSVWRTYPNRIREDDWRKLLERFDPMGLKNLGETLG